MDLLIAELLIQLDLAVAAEWVDLADPEDPLVVTEETEHLQEHILLEEAAEAEHPVAEVVVIHHLTLVAVVTVVDRIEEQEVLPTLVVAVVVEDILLISMLEQKVDLV